MSNDKKDAMPAWPIKATPEPAYGIAAQFMVDANYYQALCAAWEARCRKLQKACVRFMAGGIAAKHHHFGSVEAIADALQAIGPLPELHDLPSSERG